MRFRKAKRICEDFYKKHSFPVRFKKSAKEIAIICAKEISERCKNW